MKKDTLVMMTPRIGAEISTVGIQDANVVDSSQMIGLPLVAPVDFAMWIGTLHVLMLKPAEFIAVKNILTLLVNLVPIQFQVDTIPPRFNRYTPFISLNIECVLTMVWCYEATIIA